MTVKIDQNLNICITWKFKKTVVLFNVLYYVPFLINTVIRVFELLNMIVSLVLLYKIKIIKYLCCLVSIGKYNNAINYWITLMVCFYFTCLGYTYFIFLFVSDPRVNDWPLMQSPIPTLMMVVTYLYVVVFLGPRLMANRKPYKLNNILILYNAAQVIFSLVMLWEVSIMT